MRGLNFFLGLFVIVSAMTIYLFGGGIVPVIGVAMVVILSLLLFFSPKSQERGLTIYPVRDVLLEENRTVLDMLLSFNQAARMTETNVEGMTLILSDRVDFLSIKYGGPNNSTILYVNSQDLMKLSYEERVALFIHEIAHFQDGFPIVVRVFAQLNWVTLFGGILTALLTQSWVFLMVTLVVFVIFRLAFYASLKEAVYKADQVVKKTGFGNVLAGFLKRNTSKTENVAWFPSPEERIKRLS